MLVLWLGIKNVTVFVFLLKSISKVKKVERLTASNITVRSREPPHLLQKMYLFVVAKEHEPRPN